MKRLLAAGSLGRTLSAKLFRRILRGTICGYPNIMIDKPMLMPIIVTDF
jgi:hypothetical protein